MNNHAIKSTQGDLNYILAKYLLENINFEESEFEYLKKIVKILYKFIIIDRKKPEIRRSIRLRTKFT